MRFSQFTKTCKIKLQKNDMKKKIMFRYHLQHLEILLKYKNRHNSTKSFYNISQSIKIYFFSEIFPKVKIAILR